METYLAHHGIKGQKWGVRRYRNDDGSVTPAGAKRYYVGGKRVAGSKGGDAAKRAKIKKIIGIAAGVAVTAVVSYAGYKYVKNHPETMSGLSKKLSEITGKAPKEDSRPTKNKETLHKFEEMTKKNFSDTHKVQDKRAEYAEAIKKIKDIKARNGRGEDAARKFTWEKVARRDANGNTSYISLPTDRKGYADYFAKKMLSSPSNKEGYDYWYKYIMGRMNYQ